MKLADFNRLIKFMELTTSANDGEALNACRMANKLLVANNADWKKVFARLITIEVEAAIAGDMDPVPAQRNAPSPIQAAAKTREQLDRIEHVNHMFGRCLDRVKSGDFRKMLLDIESQWQRKNHLSPAQLDVLERTYNKHRDIDE